MTAPVAPVRCRVRLRRARLVRRPLRRALSRALWLPLALPILAAACLTRPPLPPLSRPRAAPSPTATATASAAVALNAGMLLAPGACQRFSPEGIDLHRTVFVDAGHGGPDPGGSGPAPDGVIEEKTATLAVALDLLHLLREAGYTVVLSRTRDSAVAALASSDLDHAAMTLEAAHRDGVARVACANAAHADLLLSIHFNAFGDPSVGGTETFYDDARPFAAANQRFASLVQKDVVAALAARGWSRPDRGITTDSSYDAPALSAQAASYHYLLELGPAAPGWLEAPSAMPGALCEPLFLSNPLEASIAASVAGQQALASGFARAIDDYFSPPPVTATPTTPP